MKVHKVAAQFARRDVGCSDIEARNLARAARQELKLNLSRGIEVVLQPKLIFPGILIKPRVLECDGNEGTQGNQHALLLRRERSVLRAFKIQDADQAILQQKRNHQFRDHALTGVAGDVTGVYAHVVKTDGPARSRGVAGNSAIQRHTKPRGDGVFIVHSENAFQKLRFLVPQDHGEDVVVDDFLDALGNAAQKLFAIEDRSELAAEIVEQAQRFRLLR